MQPITQAQIDARLSTIGPTILTSDGQEFDFTAPGKHEVKIEVIAAALSKICRFTGHCREFYSVAQHSVLVSRLVQRSFMGSPGIEQYRLAMYGLLHDAAEAYMGDMSGPLKKLIPAYKEIEHRVEAVVFAALGIPKDLPPEVKLADLAALKVEQQHLMPKMVTAWDCVDGIDLTNLPDCFVLRPLPPAAAQELFLTRYAQLALLGSR